MTPIEKVLSHFPDARRNGTGWMVRCGAHEDHTASLSVSEGRDGAVLLHDHGGCATDAVLAAAGLVTGDLFAPTEARTITATYDYRDAEGGLAYQVVRYHPKDFRQRRPDGTGGWMWSLNGTARVLYGLPELRAADPGRLVFVAEGERDCDRLAALGLLATTGAGGAGKWRPEYADALRGRRVAILPDADEPGRQHAQDVARSLLGVASEVRVVELPGVPPKGDVSDWLDAGGTIAGLKALVRAAPLVTVEAQIVAAPVAGPVVDAEKPLTRRVVVMANVKPERVSWTWSRYIPAGKVTVQEGDPGLGKSTMTLDLAARISRGAPMPDGTPGPAAAGVAILSAEDGLADTIRPRLEAAGADLAKVVALTAILGDGERMPSLPIDLDEIEATVLEHDAALVIIDPLMAYLAADVNSHRDQDVRRTLAPLSALAERTGAAVLVVRHLNKGSGPALYRGGGSIGIIGAARAALLVAPDPEDETRRILAVSKSNLGALPPALAYRVEGDAATGAARIAWEGTTAHTAADLLATPVDDEERGARTDAADFLRELLEPGPVAATEVRRFGRQAGISDRTLERAKRDLGVRSERDGFGPGSHVSWRLFAHTSPRNPIHRQPSGVATYAESGDVCESGAPEDAHPQGLSTFGKVEHLRADEADLTDAAMAIFGDEIVGVGPIQKGDPALAGQ